jgi:glycosyltransferase involved in cell wall biosynthesis
VSATEDAVPVSPTPKYSFVVPIYKDGDLAAAFCEAFQEVFTQLLGETSLEAGVELIFVNDGSPDNSFAHLVKLADTHPWVRVIGLSRNFGQQIAMTCGYANARGEYVGYLNVDQQDAPDQIPILLRAIESGEYDMVVGTRRRNRGRPLSRLTSVAFYWVFNLLTAHDGPVNEASLRIMSRRFTDAYNRLSEQSRFIPGLERWLGFRRGYVEIEHHERLDGKSSYTFWTRLRMAVDGIIGFSDLPLRLVAWAGLFVSLIGIGALVVLLVVKLWFVDFQSGWPSTIALILFMGGIQIGVVGLASLYIGRILREVQGRPLYLIQHKLNFSAEDSEPHSPNT